VKPFLFVCSIVYIISAPCSPMFGFIIDRLGYNVYWMLVAVVTIFGCHLLLAFTFIYPWIPMVSVILLGSDTETFAHSSVAWFIVLL